MNEDEFLICVSLLEYMASFKCLATKRPVFIPTAAEDSLETELRCNRCLLWTGAILQWVEEVSPSEGLNLGLLPILQSDSQCQQDAEGDAEVPASQRGLLPCCCQGVSQHKGGTDILERLQRRTAKVIQGLEHLFCKKDWDNWDCPVWRREGSGRLLSMKPRLGLYFCYRKNDTKCYKQTCFIMWNMSEITYSN